MADGFGMHPSIAAALEPAQPGWLVRNAAFLPGVAATAHQIEAYATYWRDLAVEALNANPGADAARMLVVLGDSLAQGVGASQPALGYAGRLRELLAEGGALPPVINLSRSGAKIADVLQDQLPALAEVPGSSHLIVCTVGSNDLVRSTRLGRSRRDMTALINALPPAALLGTLPDRGSVAAMMLNRHLRSEAERAGITVADVAVNLTTWRGHRAGDRFHPNDRGYGLWVEAFRSVLASTMTTAGSDSSQNLSGRTV